MKLMTLLTVGRSFKNSKRLGQYKVQQSLLPKFSSSVRPSKAAAEKATARLVAQGVVPTTPTPPIEPKVERPSPVVQPLDKTQKIPAGKILTRAPEPIENASAKFNVLILIRAKIAALKKRLFPPRSRKKTGSLPQQAELSLEKISVARNDLADADLEIVAPKAAAKSGSHKMHLPDFGRVKTTSVQWIKDKTRRFKTTSPFQVPAEEKAVTISKRVGKECELAERI